MKWTLIGLAACAAVWGCESSEPSIEKGERAASATVPALLEAPEPSIDPRDHLEWESIVLDAARQYRAQYGQVSGWSWITTLCVPVDPLYLRIDDRSFHHETVATGSSELGKIGVLFARHSSEYLDSHETSGSQVGQTIVKEAYRPEMYSGSSRRHDFIEGPRQEQYYAGDLTALFIMHRLEPSTPDTDDGWIYATLVLPEGESAQSSFPFLDETPSWEVTAVGKIDSCVQCHQAVGTGRLFGPDEHAFNEPLFNGSFGR